MIFLKYLYDVSTKSLTNHVIFVKSIIFCTEFDGEIGMGFNLGLGRILRPM